MNSIDGGQVWYYYDIPERSEKQERGTPVSQIPLLNGVPGQREQPPPPRRGGEGINSKYITLAKAGGRKDLLLYHENKLANEAKDYDRADWFDHPDIKPDSTVGKPRLRHPPPPVKMSKPKKSMTMLTADAPYGIDKWLNHDIDDENSDQYLTRNAAKQRALNRNKQPLPPLPIPEPTLPNLKRVGKPPLGEDEAPVSFGHLLSHGYQADWSKDMTATRKQKMSTKRRDEKEQKDKLTRHLKTMQKEGCETDDKPLFKLKKFSNVPSRVANN